MPSWKLVPSLVALRNEFNLLAPRRDKASDGSIGDRAHAHRPSDHNPDETGSTPAEDADRANEVHAIDVDKDLNTPGWTMQKAVDVIVARHRSGQDNRLEYIIYNGRIWSRKSGWTARRYTGSNPHDKHAHFSARYNDAAESGTRSWGLLTAKNSTQEEIPVDQAVFNKLMDGWANSENGQKALQQAAGRGVHNQVLGRSDETIGQDLQGDDALLKARFDALDKAIAALRS